MSYTGGSDRYTRSAVVVLIMMAIIALITMVTFLSGVFSYIGIHYMAGTNKVDPSLESESYPTVVFIAIKTSDVGQLNTNDIIHEWLFGNLTVVEYVVDSYSEVLSLAKYPTILSIYGYAEPAMVPEPLGNALAFLTQTELVNALNIAEHATYDVIYNMSRLSPADYPGNNITVCIIDSGIDYLDPDLSHAVWVLASFTVTMNGKPLVWIRGVNGTLEQAWSFDQFVFLETGHYAWMDRLGHGTMVAGIIASNGVLSNGLYMGLVPGVRLVDIKAFNASGVATIPTILSALEWVYNNARTFGISVCSFSWGIPVASNGNDPISLATEQLVNEGITVVVASGNSYLFPGTINVPASAPGVIAVGAWDPWLHEVAFFSSAGPTSSGEVKPDFLGPGVWVTSDVPVTVVSEMQEFAM